MDLTYEIKENYRMDYIELDYIPQIFRGFQDSLNTVKTEKNEK